MNRHADRGSAPVDFVLVGSLVTLFFLAVIQIAIDVHIRNVLAACAAEGARYAANADIGYPAAGAMRANALIDEALGPAYATADAPQPQDTVAGQPVVTVHVSAHLPLLAWFLPVGPTVSVTGHAFREPA